MWLLVLQLLLSPIHSNQDAQASSRFSHPIGLSAEYYTGDVLMAALDLNLGDSFRISAGAGKSLDSDNSATTVRAGLKYFLLSTDFAPYLGVEFWHVSASVSSYSFSASAFAVAGGADFVASGGFHLGFGGIYFVSYKAGAGVLSVGYFF